MSIDEETRPIGTRPRIGTVSTSIFRCRSTASTTHGVPAAGRRFARREFARQPLLRETQEWEGGGLSRVKPLLGVQHQHRHCSCSDPRGPPLWCEARDWQSGASARGEDVVCDTFWD